MEKKITDHNHDKYITAPEFNKFTEQIFATRLSLANLVTKTHFDNQLSFNRKLNQTKQNMSLSENELKNLQKFDSISLEEKTILKEMVLKII